MMAALVALAAGLLFGLGLIASGMTNPAKVQGFLDLFGVWDPSLGFVMGGAIAVALGAFTLAAQRARSGRRAWTGEPILLPTSTAISTRLVGGGVLFGMGWGLAGFCPGPGLVALGMGEPKAAVFVLAMLAGMAVFELLEKARKQTSAQSSAA